MSVPKKETVILKLGGSVITYKDGNRLKLRKTLLTKVGRTLKQVLAKKPIRLIIIHGAGSYGHRLAVKYGLKEGVKKNKWKWQGAILSQIVDQQTNATVAKILFQEGLPIIPIHPSSIIVNKNGSIHQQYLFSIEQVLKNGCIPLLYGDMVQDIKRGMSICSGDESAASLASAFRIKKVLLATDVDGVYTKDPYRYKEARLIKKISVAELKKGLVKLAGSHSQDVTGGMMGKIRNITKILKSGTTKEIIIFNGLESQNYRKVLLDQKVNYTKISIK